jgi:hypothetical protein
MSVGGVTMTLPRLHVFLMSRGLSTYCTLFVVNVVVQ